MDRVREIDMKPRPREKGGPMIRIDKGDEYRWPESMTGGGVR